VLCILKAAGVWLVLALVSTNAVALVVRGLWWRTPQVEPIPEKLRPLLQSEASRMRAANIGMTLFAAVLTVGYLFLLFRWGNVWLVVAGVLLMVARLPDLLHQIRTGEKKLRSGVAGMLAAVVMWGTLPLVWYSLCVGKD